MTKLVSNGQKIVAREVRRAVGIGACAAALLALAGCSRQGSAERTQATRAAAVGDVALRQAYEELLMAPVWALIDIEPNRYIRVFGTLKRDTEPELRLEVYYERDVTPPRLAFFKVGAKQYPPARFPEFIRWAVLNQELDACLPSAAESPPAEPPPPASAP